MPRPRSYPEYFVGNFVVSFVDKVPDKAYDKEGSFTGIRATVAPARPWAEGKYA